MPSCWRRSRNCWRLKLRYRNPIPAIGDAHEGGEDELHRRLLVVEAGGFVRLSYCLLTYTRHGQTHEWGDSYEGIVAHAQCPFELCGGSTL